MSFLKKISTVGKKIVKSGAGKAVLKSGLIGKAARAIPFVGTAALAYDAYSVGKKLLGKPKAPAGLPALSGLPSLGVPMTTGGTSGPGLLPRGPSGKLQLPWNDPSTPAALKNFALDDSYLRVYYRAPHGYVVVRDANGKPYPMMKWAARRFGLWTPGKKPPISVGEHQAIKRADRAVKKVRRIMTQVSRVDKNVNHGKVRIFKKRGK